MIHNSEFDELLREFKRESSINDAMLDELQSWVGSPLPQDYIALLKFSNGASGWLRDRYLIIYSTREVIDINRASTTKDHALKMLIFASNGGGTSYLFDLDFQDSAVYRCEDVDLKRDAATKISFSLRSFLNIFGPEIG